MEESFAIIPIGIIKDCIELIDAFSTVKDISAETKEALSKAKRLLNELPRNPKKDFFRLSFQKNRGFNKNIRDEYSITLDYTKFEMTYTYWRGTGGESSIYCDFKTGDENCSEKQFSKAQNWIHSAHKILNSSNQKSVKMSCSTEYI